MSSSTVDAPVNTKKVVDRRKLRFNDLNDVLTEADCIMAAERAGTLTRVGNWTTGQIFGHLAKWVARSIDGYNITPPLFLKLFGPLLKKRILRGPMLPGLKLPIAKAQLGADPAYPLEEGYERLKREINRVIAGEPMISRNPVFGAMTRQEWIELHLRHAELHFSFLKY